MTELERGLDLSKLLGVLSLAECYTLCYKAVCPAM